MGCFDVKIKAKHHKACPGGSHGCGSRYISVLAADFVGKIGATGKFECQGNFDSPLQYYLYFGKKVPAHGWVSIYNHNRGDYHWLSGTVKNKHGHKIWSGLLKIHCGVKK